MVEEAWWQQLSAVVAGSQAAWKYPEGSGNYKAQGQPHRDRLLPAGPHLVKVTEPSKPAQPGRGLLYRHTIFWGTFCTQIITEVFIFSA